jgi:pimeloyl-ACP methyl ester carboxylesterase
MGYVQLGELQMFYESAGEGSPLVLLHGAFGGAQIFEAQIATFSARYRVFVPEQRGRARTPDQPGPISYQTLTDDVVAFIESVVGGSTHIVGASDGGIVGVMLAIQRPDLVSRLVVIGANFHRDGLMPGAAWSSLGPDDDAWKTARQRYADSSPDGPDHWPVVFGKLQRMWREEPTLTTDDLSRIGAPVLVMVGDDDAITFEHTVAMYEAIPEAQLAVIPGASHVPFLEKPALVDQVILGFLEESAPPVTLMPMRRRP